LIKVLIADDHAFVREALDDLFAATHDIRVVAACPDGREVVEAAERHTPDVVLLDVVMPRVDGLEAARQLLAHRPHERVVMLTGTVTASSVCEAQEIGAKGYLVKGNPFDLPDHVRTVAADGTAWGREAAVHLPSC
jgi:DNA-binding NarL/FixJ family response regulator